MNYYRTLQVAESATQAEIKQAYRQLAKQFHPDSQHSTAGHEKITQINAAYEVLGDPHSRSNYDQELQYQAQAQAAGLVQEKDTRSRHQRTVDLQNHYRRQRQAEKQADDQQQRWLKQIYNPVDRLLAKVISPLNSQIKALSADPFDDELMEDFHSYLEACKEWLDKARRTFQSMPNPSHLAGVAANLYYCLNQLEDGIEEIERFTLSYDDGYLHTGQELFRIARQLRREAKEGMKVIS
ncbi:MAG: DnaJ domain-containing protein [Leptolyngbyaceae cyanobacterium MO_188.B28]|nr:DnaJ domain-containing protein [Leptolyngbyaceae cyanobacterium MO_188.B28]